MQIQAVQAPKDQAKLWIGAAIYAALLVAGSLLLVLFLFADIMNHHDPGQYLGLMFLGAGVAFTAALFYLLVPVIIDRYDPEPWWALLAAFLWGALVSCGFAGTINTVVGHAGAAVLGPSAGELVGAVVSAPVFEELFKGLLVVLMYFFLRREFDGVVDGVIYATFSALGFAAMENVLYYARAGLKGGGSLALVVVLRGILSPWCHPLFTSMTGIGFGIAREAKKTWIKVVAPVAGYLMAVVLHAAWNGTATFAGLLTGSNTVAATTMLLQIVVFILFMLVFTGIMIALVVREGRIIRKHLQDEVLIGTLTQEEANLVCSPVGRLKALFSRGGMKGRRFVRSAATLALKKWHTTRAMEGRKMTISMDFIAPLRQEIARLRAEMGQHAPQAPRAQPAPQPQSPQANYPQPGVQHMGVPQQLGPVPAVWPHHPPSQQSLPGTPAQPLRPMAPSPQYPSPSPGYPQAWQNPVPQPAVPTPSPAAPGVAYPPPGGPGNPPQRR